jgi:hypothetical protein
MASQYSDQNKCGTIGARGSKNGFPLEKRMETNRRFHEEKGLVKHHRNEHMSEIGGDGGEIGPQKGEKWGWRGDWGLFSGQLLGRGESFETGILSVD